MKTKQEQIDEMVKVIKGFDICGLFGSCFSTGADGENTRYITCPECFAEALIKAGYGDVSEYKAEIERLKAENKSQERENGFLKYCQCLTHGVDGSSHIKKAQIDVLNELKTRHDYAIKNMGYPWDITQQIDKLIEEVKNDECNC